MSRSRVECDGMVELAKALKKMTNLRSLSLHQNFIRAKGMTALFDALKGKENMEVLNLRDNFIVEEAVDGLCDFIINATKLRVLNLADCNIKLKVNEPIIAALEVKFFISFI